MAVIRAEILALFAARFRVVSGDEGARRMWFDEGHSMPDVMSLPKSRILEFGNYQNRIHSILVIEIRQGDMV